MKILVSACLLGENCKYNGSNNKNDGMLALAKEHTLIPICPECFAALSIPRPPAEIKDGRVFNKLGEDITNKFSDGAEKALYVAEESGCTIAVLKERSSSCGFGKIYDGTFSGKTFSGKLTDGNGFATDLLYKNGITIIGESEFDKLKTLIFNEDEQA